MIGRPSEPPASTHKGELIHGLAVLLLRLSLGLALLELPHQVALLSLDRHFSAHLGLSLEGLHF
jgi:hypothetical protein